MKWLNIQWPSNMGDRICKKWMALKKQGAISLYYRQSNEVSITEWYL